MRRAFIAQMNQLPTIRQKTIIVPNVPRDGMPRYFERDKELERSHIVGIRMIVVELQARSIDDKIAAFPSIGQVPGILVQWVDRERENVYDMAGAFKFAWIPQLADKNKRRQLYVPVDWKGLDTKLCSVVHLAASGVGLLSIGFEVYYHERQDIP